MTTDARPRPATSDEPKLIADDLPLRVFTTVGATIAIAWLGLPTKYALLGVALAPFLADSLKWLAERFRLGKVRLLLLTLLFFLLGKDKAEAARSRRKPDPSGRLPGGPRSVLVTAVAASIATVAGFTGPELALGRSLVADRKSTFFSPARDEPVDLVAPVLVVPADLVVDAPGPTAVTYRATARDDEDGSVVPTCRPSSGATFRVGSTVVRCTAADAAANRASRTFSVIVRRREVPLVVVVPEERRAEADGKEGTPVRYRASARNQAGAAVRLRCSPRSGDLFPLGRSTVTCVASADGDVVKRTFPVVVRDTRPPRLQLPEELRVGDAGPGGKRVTYAVSAVDAVDGAIEPRCSPPSGSVFPLGQRRVTCTVIDARGNEARSRFTVVVLEKSLPTDTQAPELRLETDLAPVEATSPAGATFAFRISAEDDRDGDVGVVCDPRSASTFRVGTTPVACSAVDSAGNRSSRAFAVVVRDTRAPELRVPQARAAEATSTAGAAVRYTAAASDVVDGPVTPTCSRASGSTFPLGKSVIMCSARDARGNESRRSFTVIVSDTTPPSIELEGGNPTAEARSRRGAVVEFAVAARDIVSGATPATCDRSSGSVFALGETTVTCSASDARGNRSAATFTVTVRDSTPPVFFNVKNVEVKAEFENGTAVRWPRLVARDAVDGRLRVTCDPPSGTLFAPGTTTSVKCAARDRAGNAAAASFTVSVSAWSTVD